MNKPTRETQEWALAAVKFFEKKGPVTVEEIIEFIDWKNHSRYSSEEIELALKQLLVLGKVSAKKGRWQIGG